MSFTTLWTHTSQGGNALRPQQSAHTELCIAHTAIRELIQSMSQPAKADHFEVERIDDTVAALSMLVPGGKHMGRLKTIRKMPVRRVSRAVPTHASETKIAEAIALGRKLFADSCMPGPQGMSRCAAPGLQELLPHGWRPNQPYPSGEWASGLIGLSYEFHSKRQGKFSSVHTDRFENAEDEGQVWVALWPLTGPLLVLLDNPTSAVRLASLQTQHFSSALLDTFLDESVHAQVRFVAAGERVLIHKDAPHAVLSLTDVIQASWSEWCV